jgi:hypothetical protein
MLEKRVDGFAARFLDERGNQRAGVEIGAHASS